MPSESKMISVRLPLELIERTDFVARNIDDDTLTTRSAVILAAIKWWLPWAEIRLRELGLTLPEEK